jgi:hypothetical protein
MRAAVTPRFRVYVPSHLRHVLRVVLHDRA